MRVADGALREGLLYDMLGRFTDEDARERSVRAMQGRYHVDLAQAERVEATALAFSARRSTRRVAARRAARASSCCAGPRGCTRSASTSRIRTITATARICSQNADMPGFPQRGAAAARGDRGRRPPAQARRSSRCERPDAAVAHQAPSSLIVLLRLAVLLHRGRSRVALPDDRPACAGDARSRSHFRRAGSTSIRLTAADLEQEIEYLQAAASGCGRQPRVRSSRRFGVLPQQRSPAPRTAVAHRSAATQLLVACRPCRSTQACALSAR